MFDQKPWEVNDCGPLKAQYAVYSIPQAAALWCGVPEEELDSILVHATPLSQTGLGRSIWKHPYVPCLEPRSRAIAEAIEDGQLPCGREDGRPVEKGEHVKYERRHVLGKDLKEWVSKTLPNEKPKFLFDDLERSSHTAISVDAYRTLRADKDAIQVRFDKLQADYKRLRQSTDEIEMERDSLRMMVEKSSVPSERAETTYKNIIAALLDCVAGNVPGIEKHPSFVSEAKLIEFIDTQYRGYGGLSRSTLSRKFPEARRHLRSQ